MNIETLIKSELWSAIEHSYGARNYTHAIKDAMYLVTDILRDKSGLDGDGDQLVGQALSYNKDKQPLIKINKLQTQTEKDVQRGLMLVLKGMYALVRNPRTHERMQDDKNTADIIILFIDYLLDYLGASSQSFTIQGFLELVTENHFVQDEEYVGVLVDLIPAKKRGDTLILLYRSINWTQADNFELVFRELLPKLTDEDISHFLHVVSDDLQKMERSQDATLIIKILPNDLWPRINRMPRLRIENMLLDLLEESLYAPLSKKSSKPSATWISIIAKYIIHKEKLRQIILNKLRSDDFDHHNFVAKFLMNFDVLQDVFVEDKQIKSCAKAIAGVLHAGNEYMKDELIDYLNGFPGFSGKWEDAIVDGLNDLTDSDNPDFYLSNGTPLLGKFESKPNPVSVEEDIPF